MWTYSLRHAVNFHNASIQKDKTVTPFEAFTGQSAPWAVSDFRVFGSPTYVLWKEFKDGTGFNKWKSRAWQGVYIGPSSCHLSAIPLIYNHTTTHISPQFHVMYDKYFQTVQNTYSMPMEEYFTKLYNTSARWMHKDQYEDETHLFESFWDPETPPYNPQKRRCTPTTNVSA